MQLQLNPPGDSNLIHSVEIGCITIKGERYRSSLILGPQHLDAAWQVGSVRELGAEQAASLLSLQPELVILGTGSRLVFPNRHFGATFVQQGVGCEVMDTLAACRTYNVLVAEGRRVFAALIIDSEDTAEGQPEHR